MPSPRSGESREAFIDRCMGDTEAVADFPDAGQRFAVCGSMFDQAQSSAANFGVIVNAQRAQAHPETFLGREFLVVPAILVRSQVLNNNLGATFLPPEEITDDWAQQWNGMPVLVGEHPRMRGTAVSGRTPELWNERGVGWIFNARAENEGPDIRRLAAEVWLDLARADSVEGYREVLNSVSAGQTVELSTGFATQVEQRQGVFEGETFEAIMHPQGPDHLVIAAVDFTGACSVRDGCGLGANSYHMHTKREFDMEQNETAATASTTNSVDSTSAGTVTIDTTTTDNHVRVDDQPTGLKKMLARLSKLFEASAPEPCDGCWWDNNNARHFQREITARNELAASDQERMQMLRDALQEVYGGADKEVVVTDVFTTEQRVVFWLTTPLGPQPAGAEFFQSQWSQDEGGKLSFTEPARVRRMTAYVPAEHEAAGSRPAEAGNSTTHEEEVVMADQEKGVDLSAQLASLTEAVGKLTEKVTAIEEQAKADPNPAIAGLKRTVAELAERFDGMEGVTKAAILERERERQDLVRVLSGNYRVPFTQADLEGKPIEELRKLAEMVKADNFAARGGPQKGGSISEQRFAEPVPYWLTQKEAE